MRKPPRQGGWYRRKSFAHFDLPLDFQVAEKRVKDPAYVCGRSFWPFIGYDDIKRRFRTISGLKYVDTKKRPIKYCSHQDGYIFAYYGAIAADRYEKYLASRPFEATVIGYRAGLGSNIDMARSVFEEIASRKRCVAICLDISSFFDNIDHLILKSNLQRVLGVARLSNDWFAIFKAMTKFAWVDATALADRLQFDRHSPPRPLCDAKTFREKVRGDDPSYSDLVQPHAASYGIPQGSPISATFSNIYMLDFDEAMHAYIKKCDGAYKRYSDDIVVVCRPNVERRIRKFIEREMAKLGGKLKIGEEKTEVSRFERGVGGLRCDVPVTYLGFTYDGRRVTLRGRTLSRYYRRMTYAARRAAAAARREGTRTVYMRSLYRDFSHLGRSNFYSYAERASEVFDDDAPKRQLRRHTTILKRKTRNGGR